MTLKSVNRRIGTKPALAPLVVSGLAWLVAATAHANGRLPGATGLAIHPDDPDQLLLGLTFGLAITRDGGAGWSWMCEQQIEGNGGNVDPAIVLTHDGSIVVLSLTNGGVLVSRNNGCSFERASGPLQGSRGVDLELDASRPGRVLVLMSTLVEVLESGHPRFRNFLAHSLDHGGSWELLAELPDDMAAETVELAPSDPRRIYVSGTATADPLQGIVERSDDGGRSWTRSSVRLPRGSGSLFVSGIHPRDPDRVWFRVPGRGDAFGVLPTRLWLSQDGAMSFQPVADTQAGMLGFAISPDGERIAFGGPLDGLFIAPSDASAPASKVSDLHVSCLRWRARGLYACAIEPADPFTLGFTADPTRAPTALWRRSSTCREACSAASTLEAKCQEPWEMLAPLLDATSAVCSADAPALDAGVASAAGVHATRADTAGAPAAHSCSLSHAPGARKAWWLVLVAAAVTRLRRHMKLRRSASWRNESNARSQQRQESEHVA